MEHSNHTRVTEFIMKGLFDHLHHQGLFFGLFLCIYIAVVMGNSLIIVSIVIHPPLHTPMYFFIANLALADILCTSSVVPKVLENLMQEKKIISFGGCITQLFVFTSSLTTDVLLLTVMSYDRYVAICHTLHYVKLMNKEICICLAVGVWAVGTINSLVNMLLLLDLHFCGPNLIQHFFCEFPAILVLSCSSTYVNKIMIFMAMGNFLLTIVSYSFIVITILKIQSSKGKQRAFSTCSSHLLVVTLYYSTIIYTYNQTTSSYSSDKNKMVAIMYSLVTPTLNPVIYSLHNKEVKVAMKRIFSFTTKISDAIPHQKFVSICIHLAVNVWAVGTINSFANIFLVLHLDFCRPNLIQYFFCDFPTILALSCSSTYVNEIMMFMADIFLAMGNFLLTTMSYCFIIISILKIQSSKGKQRAFSTCSSHLLVVTLYYSTIIYTYIQTNSSNSLDKNKKVAIMYTLVTPTLNPVIYSLHNKEVKVAIKRILPFTTKSNFSKCEPDYHLPCFF
ncbi:olfactory receptor 13G1-like [Gopherus evgoodei]|uniref:olfactory receptor 13G1-like n=1 Tax=Gopherus evgoodei TaxID=1825980 RepID=UPI0011CF2228|nr:olfactory receptor 13G1-like [Gopherus evgoodei]